MKIMEKTIWTPCFSAKYDFAVSLNRDFAREMIQVEIPSERQQAMNNVGNEVLQGLGDDWRNPYTFYNNSCLVSQVYLGQNGVWLATDITPYELLKEKSSKPIGYHSHNVDTSKQAYTLLALFGKWIEYADILKDA